MNLDSTTVQNMSAILLEIGTEEIPSRFLPNAITDLKASAAKHFTEYRIDYADITVFATPRRLSLMVTSVSASQKDNVKEVFGPARKAAYDEQGNPTKAASGFASSLGLTAADLKLKLKGKGEYVVAIVEEKGTETKTVLPELLKKIVMSLHFPKSMRWGNGSMTFVRPISWILAISDADKVEFDIDGLKSGNQTRGHRFLSPASFQIKDISSYKQFLDTNFVILDQNKRQDLIIKSMDQLIQSSGLQVITDNALLEIVNYLVEYPVPVLCSFDREYLKLPKELLITVMKDHQKYFALQDSNGNLANSFVVISNTKAENAEMVRIGAQRVIKARFDDAKFYYREDSVKPLAERVDSLRKVTFHDQLGSQFDRVERIESIAGFLADRLLPNLKDKAVRAARLSKTDLITGVVREFPELQGIMGRYYADHDREDREIVEALGEQYMPKSFGDCIPQTDVGAVLSLADKIDNIAAFFSIGIIPTGSEDPFALRRQAMGIISIFLAKEYSLSLHEVFAYAVGAMTRIKSPDIVMEQIMTFMNQRTEFILTSAGHDQEIIKSVLRLSFTQPLKFISARIEAVNAIRSEKIFPEFLLAIKRVNNIVPKTELPPVQTTLLHQEEEKNLHTGLMSMRDNLLPALEQGNFAAAVNALLPITPDINSFFDKVLVMDKQEEIKINRLALLREIWETVAPVADFSKFQS